MLLIEQNGVHFLGLIFIFIPKLPLDGSSKDIQNCLYLRICILEQNKGHFPLLLNTKLSNIATRWRCFTIFNNFKGDCIVCFDIKRTKLHQTIQLWVNFLGPTSLGNYLCGNEVHLACMPKHPVQQGDNCLPLVGQFTGVLSWLQLTEAPWLIAIIEEF